MSYYRVYGRNRNLCDCLYEMREIVKTINRQPTQELLLSLIEEVQVHGNRMEAALSDKRDVLQMYSKIRELKSELKKLEAKKEALDGAQKKNNHLGSSLEDLLNDDK